VEFRYLVSEGQEVVVEHESSRADYIELDIELLVTQWDGAAV
jgi:hypothetical protein